MLNFVLRLLAMHDAGITSFLLRPVFLASFKYYNYLCSVIPRCPCFLHTSGFVFLYIYPQNTRVKNPSVYSL